MLNDNNASPQEATLSRSKRRGFTLTEIAIVLGIIGLILGAIWVAASAVYNNLRLSRAQQELLQVAQAVRSMYATQNVISNADGNVTAPLASAGIFPTDAAILNGNTYTVTAPWAGSTIQVDAATFSVVADSFIISMVNIPASACIQLLTNVTGTGRDPGLVWANAATGTAAPVNDDINNSPIAIPVNPTDAQTHCGGTNAASSVAFGFRLKG